MKYMKKLLFLVLALTLYLGLFTPASAAQASFSDVKSSDWFYPYVTQLVQAGGVHGYPDGTFKPNATITRAEVATIAVNLFPPDHYIEANCPQSIYNAYKANVEKGLANHWAKDAVLKAYCCMADTPDDMNYVMSLYGWDQPATRADIAVILVRTYMIYMFDLGKIDLPTGFPHETYLLVGDFFEEIQGTEAMMDICWMYSEGVVSGINDRGDYNPRGYATRAECSKIVVNLLDPSKRDEVDWSKAQAGGNPENTGSDGVRYEKDFTGQERPRYAEDVAYDYCRALEQQIGIQIFYIPYEWTEKADGLFSSDEVYAYIQSTGPVYFENVLTELKKMKAAFDLYPNGFLKEMAQKKGTRKAEIILCPYTPDGMSQFFHGQYVYDYSSDAKKVDQIYYLGTADSQSYSHEIGHMVTSAVGILNGWDATCAAWERMMTTDGGSYISNYAITSRPEDKAETWAYLWHQPQTVIQACSNAGLKAKVQYLTQILDKNYSTFHADQAPWASVLK